MKLKLSSLLFIVLIAVTLNAGELETNSDVFHKRTPVEEYYEWSPTDLVRHYVESDLSGIFIEGYESHVLNNVGIINFSSSYNRQKTMLFRDGLEWRGPVLIVNEYSLNAIEVTDCLAWIEVTFKLVGEYDRNNSSKQFYKNKRSEKIIFVLANTEYGWRIVESAERPHLGVSWILSQDHIDSVDVEYLKSYQK